MITSDSVRVAAVSSGCWLLAVLGAFLAPVARPAQLSGDLPRTSGEILATMLSLGFLALVLAGLPPAAQRLAVHRPHTHAAHSAPPTGRQQP
jgi:hypothetical protein